MKRRSCINWFVKGKKCLLGYECGDGCSDYQRRSAYKKILRLEKQMSKKCPFYKPLELEGYNLYVCKKTGKVMPVCTKNPTTCKRRNT